LIQAHPNKFTSFNQKKNAHHGTVLASFKETQITGGWKRAVERSVLIEKQNGIATIYLNEPSSLNALSLKLKADLANALKLIEYDHEISVVILAGKGKSFCAGGDVKGMAEIKDPLEIKRNMEESSKIIESIRRLNKITIAAVHGYLAGAGISLALASDMILAEEGAKFVFSFKNVGLIPDLGLHYHLPRLVGEWKAKEWIWSCAKISAEEAKSLGFVKEVVPKGKVHEEACKMAAELMEGPIHALISSKIIINSSAHLRLEDVQKMEVDRSTILRGTYDHQEGVQAFLEKRTPVFRGR
jgi:2-(1,2-epoxy-1,2-dihydrophenyl)acetyl-CoA isomerase